jgi:hypothetical protein
MKKREKYTSKYGPQSKILLNRENKENKFINSTIFKTNFVMKKKLAFFAKTFKDQHKNYHCFY